MNRTVAPADTAHYDARLAELSTLLASHDRSNSPCAGACDGRRPR